jgi:hypothetical protein
MSALIPPVAPSCNAAERIHLSTTPWDGSLAAIFLPRDLEPRIHTDEHGLKTKIRADFLQRSECDSFLSIDMDFTLHFFDPCSSV